MISIEAKKYSDRYWFLVREWDGYDRPHRELLFKITEDEVDFEGGRFERRKIGKFKHRVVIGLRPPETPESMIDWITENTTGQWYIDIDTDIMHDVQWQFYFMKDEDATAFKLRWCDENNETYYHGDGPDGLMGV